MYLSAFDLATDVFFVASVMDTHRNICYASLVFTVIPYITNLGCCLWKAGMKFDGEFHFADFFVAVISTVLTSDLVI